MAFFTSVWSGEKEEPDLGEFGEGEEDEMDPNDPELLVSCCSHQLALTADPFRQLLQAELANNPELAAEYEAVRKEQAEAKVLVTSYVCGDVANVRGSVACCQAKKEEAKRRQEEKRAAKAAEAEQSLVECCAACILYQVHSADTVIRACRFWSTPANT